MESSSHSATNNIFKKIYSKYIAIDILVHISAHPQLFSSEQMKCPEGLFNLLWNASKISRSFLIQQYRMIRRKMKLLTPLPFDLRLSKESDDINSLRGLIDKMRRR